MANNRYKPMQVRPTDYEDFKRLCAERRVSQVNGFKLAMEVWKNDF